MWTADLCVDGWQRLRAAGGGGQTTRGGAGGELAGEG
jgi:hypothetical protein